jgi:hypothetical protein
MTSTISGDPTFFFLKPPYAWIDADKYGDLMLGAFVKSYPSPSDNCIPPFRPDSESHSKYATSDILESLPYTDFILDTHASVKKDASVTLENLANLNFTGETKYAYKLEGKVLKCRRLTEIDDFFVNVTAETRVKDRVLKWVKEGKRESVRVVIGIMICEDVTVVWEGERTSRSSSRGRIAHCNHHQGSTRCT